MESWLQTGLVVFALLSATAAFIWLAIRTGSKNQTAARDMDFAKMADRKSVV